MVMQAPLMRSLAMVVDLFFSSSELLELLSLSFYGTFCSIFQPQDDFLHTLL